jgi:Uncharacterized protein, homolog of Cu resistance protein CopC
MVFTVTRTLCASLFLTCTLSASSAWAHAHLQQQIPAADSEVSTAPHALTLHFSEGVETHFSGVSVTGPDGNAIKTGNVVRSNADKAQLEVPLEQTLTPGLYQVDWHVVSVDGHKTKGHYQFSVK